LKKKIEAPPGLATPMRANGFDFEELERVSPAPLEDDPILMPLGALGEVSSVQDHAHIAKLKRKEKDINGFTKIPFGVTSDSGASDTVAPEEVFLDYPLEPSPGSRTNVWYVGAGGQRIKNQGQRQILILTKEKRLRWITVQVAKVKKLLGSVSKNNDYGQRVVYDLDESYIQDKKTGEKVNLEREKGVFKFDAWVVPYATVQTGQVKFRDSKGEVKVVRVNRAESFSRQG